MSEQQPVLRTVSEDAAEREAIERIQDAVRRVVVERPDIAVRAYRDVHRKHHACVWGWFVVAPGIPEDLRKGVFARREPYKVWIRFSSSSKRAQSDTEPDGRGIAIKLLEVDGPRLRSGDDVQDGTQDFILLNGPAFFASDAQNFAVAAELEADDQFPSGFFASKSRLRGLAALLRMSSTQADSPLDLVYYSQTPYRLGDQPGAPAVKYRLVPRVRKRVKQEGSKGSNYIFTALQDALRPDSNDVPDGFVASARDAVFDFGVQVGKGEPDFPIDDATVVWDEQQSPFVKLAELRIPRQGFGTVELMELAEHMSFNPWNGIASHEPLGSINRARLFAYEASRAARHTANRVAEPDYTNAWNTLRATPGTPTTPPSVEVPGAGARLARALATIAPKLASLPARFFASRWGYGAAPALLGALVFSGLIQESRGRQPWYAAPIIVGGAQILPSEAAIPAATFARGKSADSVKNDVKWLFRYGSVGAEGQGGLPYWIFRALPRMLPQYFGQKRDWSEFGFIGSDDEEYYTSYHKLPRGMVLTEPIASLGGNLVGVGIQLVTFNCSTCHRGEYLDRSGNSHFVDGMPNVEVDTAGYKKAVFSAMRDDRFNPENVIGAINDVLADEHANPLTSVERLAYLQIVKQAKKNAWAKPIGWMDQRPTNGLGRLDAFGALRFEFLGFPAEPPGDGNPLHIATVDLPSIWHQGKAWRPWHHYDGNTAEERARNFGAIIGIGGIPETLRRPEIERIGKWIDEELEAPRYPFRDKLDAGLVKKGGQIYSGAICPDCHGTYDEDGKLAELTKCMTTPIDVGTDAYRYKAVDDDFVAKLNDFGASHMVWDGHAFVSRRGYLCPPLDGIWARAPYLHNGSVATLDDLLKDMDDRSKGTQRPSEVERGNPRYDEEKGGFLATVPPDRPHFELRTTNPGDGAEGHDFTMNDADDRKALVAYLLTL